MVSRDIENFEKTHNAPLLRKLRQEDHECDVTLGCINQGGRKEREKGGESVGRKKRE